MLDFLPPLLKGCLSMLAYVVNTLFWASLLFVVSFFKWVIPIKPWRQLCDRFLNVIAGSWIRLNNINQSVVNTIQWDIQGTDNLAPKNWYLVVANHQSWVDILVLQRIFHKKIPFLKFFLKKELIWVPVLGLAWWALEFPFMKRYSKSFLQKNPHLKGKDIEITRKACEKYKNIPTSVMNFLEGTRFSQKKHRNQKSPYKHLLKPKSGGIAYVLSAMGDQMQAILDVTIVYPLGAGSFWAFLCGKIPKITVHVREIPITDELKGDYFEDREYRVRFQKWVNELWASKDKKVDILTKYALP